MIPFNALMPAQPAFNAGGALYSTLYDDVYASADGAFAQALHVFLGGNGLPERWRAREHFVVLETGFGAAVNFLTTWDVWRRTAAPDARLHYLSVEKHPFARADFGRVVAGWTHCRELGQQLLERYPPLVCGFHRLTFEAGRICLTLVFGDVTEVLPELEARADAFFLDGFAPAKNPQMWNASVFGELARLAAPRATAATYTVAASVREGLMRAGFTVHKTPGFGRKHDMLRAEFGGAASGSEQPSKPAHAVVIGAGLAGSACAARLAARSVEVEVIERHAMPAQEASGNPAGLAMPAFSLDWNPSTRLTATAFLYAVSHLAASKSEAWHATGVLQVARDVEHLARQQRIIERYRLPQELVRPVDLQEGTALAGHRVAGSGWWLGTSAWAEPARLCREHLAGLKCWFQRRAAKLARTMDGRWSVWDETGALITSADVVILANAYAARDLVAQVHWPLSITRGQVSYVPAEADTRLAIPVCREGFITPAVAGLHCVGASYDPGVSDLTQRIEDHRGNMNRLQRLLPDYAAHADAAALSGRVGLRTVAVDRMPIVGPCYGPHAPGLYACVALASRGLTYAPLLAELLASIICDEPLPLERGLLPMLDPARFALALQTRARSW